VRDTPEQARFETLVLPHLAAYNPALWSCAGAPMPNTRHDRRERL
jgi:hypothetical protein